MLGLYAKDYNNNRLPARATVIFIIFSYCITNDVNRQQVVDDSVIKLNHQPVDDFIDEKKFHIPWEHHILILGKCKGN